MSSVRSRGSSGPLSTTFMNLHIGNIKSFFVVCNNLGRSPKLSQLDLHVFLVPTTEVYKGGP